MKHIQYIKFSALSILLVFLLAGCSGYGKIIIVRKGMPVTIDDLVSNSDNYNIYYHGYSNKLVSGIIFEPKNDNKSLVLDGLWVKEDDKNVIADVVERIRDNDFPGYLPKHYQIIGSSNGMYGYIYTGWSHVAIKQLDKDTLSVYGLKGPPEYEDGGPDRLCVF